MKKIIHAAASHKLLSIIVIVAIAGGGYFVIHKLSAATSATQYVLGTVTRDTLISTVSGTGQVAATNQVDLSPQGSGGVVTSVKVKQGDMVKAGQIIATIDEKNALVTLSQAKASLASAKANYDKVVGGPTASDLATNVQSVDGAEQSLRQLAATDYMSIYNMLHTSLDQFFIDPTADYPIFGIDITDSTGSTVTLNIDDLDTRRLLQTDHWQVAEDLKAWNTKINDGSTEDLNTLTQSVTGYLQDTKKFTNDLSTALNSVYYAQSKYQSNIESYKSTAASANSSILSMINALQNSEQSLANAKSALSIKQIPAEPADIASAQAELTNAQASYDNAVNVYDANIIKAPFDGQVAAVNVSVGDTASASTAVATVVTKQEIAEVTLNEVDVAKIKVGDKATLTFDALPDLTVSGTVAEVDTIGSVTQGVVNYGVRIALDTEEDSIKPGMSVSAEIITDSKANVLVVPNSALKSDSNGSYVLVENKADTTATTTMMSEETPTAVSVQTGTSNDTETEITSGLTEGENIVVRTVTAGAKGTTPAAAAGRSATGLLGGSGGGFGGAGGFSGGRGAVTRIAK